MYMLLLIIALLLLAYASNHAGTCYVFCFKHTVKLFPAVDCSQIKLYIINILIGFCSITLSDALPVYCHLCHIYCLHDHSVICLFSALILLPVLLLTASVK